MYRSLESGELCRGRQIGVALINVSGQKSPWRLGRYLVGRRCGDQVTVVDCGDRVGTKIIVENHKHSRELHCGNRVTFGGSFGRVTRSGHRRIHCDHYVLIENRLIFS